uniref:Photosystem I reaction center subunit VIII n=1 Tax=Prumnopitys andina TaxID=120634 RepID=A0A3Q9WVX1_9CONI|nr:photosystem I subunit VIII [Prumnopitys andina]BBF91203.1 photosystem I subunit VIII [Prumnopitys andina]
MANIIPSIFVPLVGLFLPAATMAFLYLYIQKDQIL